LDADDRYLHQNALEIGGAIANIRMLLLRYWLGGVRSTFLRLQIQTRGPRMTRTEMIAALDEEIRRLETARTLLRNSRDVTSTLALRNGNVKPAKKRQISPEGRRRIIEAQRRRWAKQKKEGRAKAR
jgi:hypothetical protein